jgi:hypothetical protein
MLRAGEAPGPCAKDEAGRGLQSTLESDVLWRGPDQDPGAYMHKSKERSCCGEGTDNVQSKLGWVNGDRNTARPDNSRLHKTAIL